ncbi:TPA: hypothetical protein ACKRXW_003501 [Proteus mirabilis]|uniref:hypothetical protein n=1 Tax=Enterobacterales TaxID=91347 RepID=UPI0005087594|nr:MULTISPECIES: hypothetical protein [Enterobacterales]DAQ78795.1 MAG TPA: hypothetical protein [Caudoviricetes sp.]AWF42681.1 hypothetical protein CSC16_1186 [Proteus mirabilis]EIT1738444.1 hypothetical protein [Proteus mirabilis]EKT8251474.1 hypothetical protein [Proteus mirabilis]EKU6773060.1 hypothetical protein [Proteus mirabilis]
MSKTTDQLINNLKHNFKLLETIYQSGLSIYYNTDVIHDAIDAIIDELRRRGVAI